MGEYYISLPIKTMSKPNASFSTGRSNGVFAIVITFFPDSEFPGRLAKIAAQVSRVIVVDNGTTGESMAHLETALGVGETVTCIRNGENLGIAAALNRGIRRGICEDRDCSWVVTFDQDSLPAEGMVEKMLRVWRSYPDQDKLMLAGPRTVFVDDTSRPDPTPDRSWLEVTHVITSGSLIPRRAFELAGYFSEDLFIDYVDIEYCLRLRTLGYRVIEVLDTEILHHMGRLEERLFCGEKVHPTHHPPQRRYYQFRNLILLHRQYRKAQPSSCRKNNVVLFKILILILLYERQRLRSIAQIMKGIFHGLLGRAGRQGEKPYAPLPMKPDGNH